MTKRIRTDTWHYWLWNLTYIFSQIPKPRNTYTCHYWPRIIFMTAPTILGALLLVVFVGIGAMFGNAVTILCGFGIWMPWNNWPDKFGYFPDLRLGKKRIWPPIFLVPFWAVAVLWGGWSWYIGPLRTATSYALTYGMYPVAAIAAIVVCYFFYQLAGFLKELLEEWWDNQCEYIEFEDPPEEPSSAIS